MLLRSVAQKRQFSSVAQKCRSEVSMSSVDQKCWSEVLLRTVKVKKFFGIRGLVVNRGLAGRSDKRAARPHLQMLCAIHEQRNKLFEV